MATIRCSSIGEFNRRIRADMRARQRRIAKAVRKTARRGVGIVKTNVPVAFGELRKSVHADGERIVVDAPHAAPVEVGSRPHRPPIEPLIAWVQLRGLAVDVEDARRIAHAIANKIEQRGTRPHYYAGDSVPGVTEILDAEIKSAMPDPQ